MINRLPIFTAMLLALAACGQTKPADVLGDRSPDNPALGIRPIHSDAIREYNHREPVEPRPWRRSNDEQSPDGKGGS